MSRLLCFFLCVAWARAAVLRGTVLEAQTGKPLARTLVAVHPVTGTAGATQSTRTESNGVFQFPSISPGVYIVSASRKGFAPKAADAPVTVKEGEDAVLRIAMPRFGSITGRISDEADVALPEHEVIAYKNTRPPVMAGKGSADDRGVYRISGLAAGSYLVRTAAKQFDDGAGYLPTFYPETSLVDRARPVEVKLDRETPDVNIRPTPGRLFEVSGAVQGAGSQIWTVSLQSDMGVETATTDSFGRFRFAPAAPGKYELLAQSPRGAAWLALELDRDRPDTRLQPQHIPTVEFAFENGAGDTVNPASVQLIARRKDLSGPGEPQYLALANQRAQLAPGRWQFSAAPNSSYYTRGWTDALVVFSAAGSLIHLTLRPNPGTVRGVVTNASGEAAAGAPVYLLGEGGVRTTRSDIHGAYSFLGLAPGEYRVANSADADSGGESVTVEEGREFAVNLKLRAGAP